MNATPLAILGGTPISPPEQTSPFPRFSERAVERVSALLRSGTTVGLNKSCGEIEEAERRIAEWQNMPYCLGTASGHAALHSALMGLEITSGDEVITTPYTWGASVSCILHNNAIPVFADVDPATGLLDPASVEACITPRTKAILPVHLFGQPVDMTAICSIADRCGLEVIEDGSQAHGALHRGKKVGTFGGASGFSCMGGKLLATTEAGYLVTSSEDVYWKASMGGQHMGRSPEEGYPDALRPYADSLVYTYRLNPVSAVLLTEQLDKVDAEIVARRKNAAHFIRAMRGVTSVSFPRFPAGDEPSYHLFTMIFDSENAKVSRKSYLAALKAEGVGVFSYVPSPIPTWPRLRVDAYDGPRIMWTENLRRYGVDYRTVETPGCDARIASSIEMGWNYLDEDAAAMAKLADAFIKVEEHLDELAEWERRSRKD